MPQYRRGGPAVRFHPYVTNKALSNKLTNTPAATSIRFVDCLIVTSGCELGLVVSLALNVAISDPNRTPAARTRLARRDGRDPTSSSPPSAVAPTSSDDRGARATNERRTKCNRASQRFDLGPKLGSHGSGPDMLRAKVIPMQPRRLSFQNQRHRPVVHQLDIHHRTEFAGLDGDLAAGFLAQQPHEPFVEGDRDVRRCSIDEARATPFAGITIERELRNNEDPAVSLGEVAIHLPCVISEHPQAEDLVRHPGKLRIRIRRRETGEHEKAGPDLSGNPAFHPNLRAPDPLEDDSHSTVTDFAKLRGWSTLQPRRTAI